MRKLVLSMFMVVFLAGCPAFHLVSSYDPVVDAGITDFSVQYKTFIKNMADKAGKEEGTYEANIGTYNALDAKLDVLIAREAAASEGQGCKLEAKVYDKIEKIMQNDMPAELKQSGQTSGGNGEGCNTRLLQLVKSQLELVRQIHKSTDKCAAPDGKEISCLRPATIGTMNKIMDQSINAVSVVETAKRL